MGSYKRTKNRIPVQHMPNESESCSVIWKSVSGFDASTVHIAPRAVWFNEEGVFKLTPYPSLTLDAATNPASLTAAQETILGETAIYLDVPVAGFVSGAFRLVQTEAGTDLASASAAYFVW